MRAVSMENSGQWSVASGQSLAILAERFGKCSRAGAGSGALRRKALPRRLSRLLNNSICDVRPLKGHLNSRDLWHR